MHFNTSTIYTDFLIHFFVPIASHIENELQLVSAIQRSKINRLFELAEIEGILVHHRHMYQHNATKK